jgi:broad specificity phosphatase PhoE
MAPAELLVVRHAQSTWNAERRWAGQLDPELSAAGRTQAAALATRLAAEETPFAAVACSDLRRARQTAAILAMALGLPEPASVPGLRERRAGRWEGLTSPEIEERFPGALERWRRGEVVDQPGGEPWGAFTIRVVAALAELARGNFPLPAVVVAHQGVLRALEHHFGVAPRRAADLRGLLLDARLSRLAHW